MKVKSESEVTQSCLTLSDPMDCSLPDPSVQGIFQARVLEWGAIALSMYTILQLLKSSYSMVLKKNLEVISEILRKRVNKLLTT